MPQFTTTSSSPPDGKSTEKRPSTQQLPHDTYEQFCTAAGIVRAVRKLTAVRSYSNVALSSL